jgi:hypothetical protein
MSEEGKHRELVAESQENFKGVLAKKQSGQQRENSAEQVK